jgi:hypothetical protein
VVSTSPFINVTSSISLVQRTAFARISGDEERIPSLYKLNSPLFNDGPGFSQLEAPHSPRIFERDGIEPKLRETIFNSYMNMRRLVIFVAVEEKPVRPFSENLGHDYFSTGSA